MTLGCKPVECPPPSQDMLRLYDFPVGTEWVLRGVEDTTIIDTLRVVKRREETEPMNRGRREACEVRVYSEILHATSPNVDWGENAYWILTGRESTQAENYVIEQTGQWNIVTPEVLYHYYPGSDNFVSWDGTGSRVITYETSAGSFEGVRAIYIADISGIYATVDTANPAVETVDTLYFHPELGFMGLYLRHSGELQIIDGSLL